MSQWTAEIDWPQQKRVQRVRLLADESRAVSYEEVVRLWQVNRSFREFFTRLLSDSPFETLRWETPAVTYETLTREFECVLVDSPGLASTVDALSFASHFSKQSSVVHFANLRGDAELVVPCPVADATVYRHLASFIRGAPSAQVDQLWQMVGQAMYERLSKDPSPTWLSTAGAGVSWLHVRLDSRPKYYHFAPYKEHP